MDVKNGSGLPATGSPSAGSGTESGTQPAGPAPEGSPTDAGTATDVPGSDAADATDVSGGGATDATDVSGSDAADATDVSGGGAADATDVSGGDAADATDVSGGDATAAHGSGPAATYYSTEPAADYTGLLEEISAGVGTCAALLGTLTALALFFWCHARIRNAARKFTGRDVNR